MEKLDALLSEMQMFILYSHDAFLHGVIIIMDFQWFDDLAAVQATGHFSLVAQKSHISQPASSRRIKTLEDWAGFSFVDRRSRPVSLTPAGE